MRRLLSAIFVALFALLSVAPVSADRVQWYPGENPTSTNMNLTARVERVKNGSVFRDFFGAASAGGAYGDVTISPSSGMYITAAPTTSNTDGTIYQLVQSDVNPIPVGWTPQLAADPTIIMGVGLLAAQTAPIGPFTAPGAGTSVYYLVEAQLSQQDTSPTTQTLVNTSGQKSTQTVNNMRSDVVTFQIKSGTPAASPTVPNIDSGWIPVATVLVPSGVSSITAPMIAQNNPCGPGSTLSCAPFSGFVQNAQVMHVSGSATPSPDTGNAALSGNFSAATLSSTTGTGTAPFSVNSTTQVPNLYASRAALADTATVATTANNVGPSPLPQSQGGTGSATPSGVACGASGNLSCSGAFPAQTVDLKSTLSGLTSVGTTSATIGNLNATTAQFPSLTSQGCLGTDSSGNLQAGTCGGGGGYAYNASAPLSVTTSSGSVTYGCSSCVATSSANLFTGGSNTIAPAGTATSGGNFGSAGGWQLQNSNWNGSAAVTNTWSLQSLGGNNLALQYNGSTMATVGTSGAYSTGSSSYGPTSANVNGAVVAIAANGLPMISDNGTIAQNVGTGYLMAYGTAGTAKAGLIAYGCTQNATHPCLLTHGGTVSGITGTEFEFGIQGVSDDFTFDGTNVGIHGNYATGSSTYGATGATVNGGITVANSGVTTTNGANFQGDASGNAYLTAPGGATAKLSSTLGDFTLSGGSNNRFVTGSSLYGATSATVNGTVSSILAYGSGNYSYVFKSGTSNGNTGIGVGTGWTAATVACSEFGIVNYTVSVQACLDNTGNWGVAGNVYSTAAFFSSRREWKHDIKPLNDDALAVLNQVQEWRSFYFNADHGDPKVRHVGFIANTAPVVFSGPKHDHFDVEAVATYDARAVLELNDELHVMQFQLRSMVAFCLLLSLVSIGLAVRRRA